MPVFLAPHGADGTACGKVILIGEHAAVDGHPAIALPLREQSLRVELKLSEQIESNDENICSDWNSCWQLNQSGVVTQIAHAEKIRLTQSLELALKLLTGGSAQLTDFSPQPIVIDSRIPLGAGMGGSAALSAALIRALAQALGMTPSAQEVGWLANELDGMFHGRASGLDAATVVSDSIISFEKSSGSSRIANGQAFWLLLIDTGERTPTRDMVMRVAALRERSPETVAGCFSTLATLAGRCRELIPKGEIVEVASLLTQAHQQLQLLKVSTPALDACVEDLLAAGAVGAKLTGGGGGGLALGLFINRPSIPLSGRWQSAPHFLTFVPADKSS
ncbi:MAG: hypothetical protein RLZZ488_2152 [Pseudomonadota bacterium]